MLGLVEGLRYILHPNDPAVLIFDSSLLEMIDKEWPWVGRSIGHNLD